jgi:hypothetical protein
MSEEGKGKSKILGQLISKAWSDEAFKARLLSDTMATLKEHGIEVPEGVTVKAVENADKVFHIVIPSKPSRKLSEDELAKIAAGCAVGCCMTECSWREGTYDPCH